MAITLDGTNGITTPGETVSGTGVWSVGGTQLYKDASGNLGLGVTPSAWGSGYKALQFATYGSVYDYNAGYNGIASNSYYNGTNWIYRSTNFATRYEQYAGGTHAWYNALSGTAGSTISFTQAMTLNASGNLGIGATNIAATLHITDAGSGGSSGTIQLGNISTLGYYSQIYQNINYLDLIANGDQAFRVSLGTNNGTGNIRFFTASGTTGNTERARVDFNGYLLVGYTSSNGAYKLQVNSQIFATSATIATSDANYKKNVTPLIDALSLVGKLNPVSFDWKEHPVHAFDTENTTVGFLAQELQSAMAGFPYVNSIVKESEVTLLDGKKEKFLGIAEGNMIAILTKAIQELTARLEALEAK